MSSTPFLDSHIKEEETQIALIDQLPTLPYEGPMPMGYLEEVQINNNTYNYNLHVTPVLLPFGLSGNPSPLPESCYLLQVIAHHTQKIFRGQRSHLTSLNSLKPLVSWLVLSSLSLG